MALFNTEYYSGIDKYSDGDIENDILDIVKGNKDISMYYGKYPVIYHLSQVRENIINWYPFDKNAYCLEIGAGCGAITSALCEKLGFVVSVDISKRRSEINYERHKDIDNLQIIAGNIHEIKFDYKFDYIILNGVFEYAMSFTRSENNHYVEFLSYIKSLLKENGHILIAIENRLGLKYFSGSPEDHTDQYFLGLNGYAGNYDVRTFSKSEIKEIINVCGFKNTKFYYPYPDYKFPTEIFTDATVNSFNYGRDSYNLNKKTFLLFNEQNVFSDLAKEGVADIMANSFLVEISNSDNISDVIYAKLNSERNKEFRIATIIREKNGKRIVEKSPLSKYSKFHIKKLYDNRINDDVIYNGYSVEYKYYDCKSLNDVESELISKGDIDGVIEVINRFFENQLSSSVIRKYSTDEFKSVFGNSECKIPLECIKPANIDLIGDNIMLYDGGYALIDNEWVFDFDIPVKFIIWRHIREMFTKNGTISNYVSFENFLEKFGIKDDMNSVFYDWATHFVDVYVGDGITKSFAKNKKYIDFNQYFYSMFSYVKSSVYIDTGKGYSENSKIDTELEADDNGNFEMDITIPKDTKEIRWDPVEQRCCRCFIESINGDIVSHNGFKAGDFDCFENGDPQYIIKPYENRLKVKGKLYLKNIFDSSDVFINKIKDNEGEIAYKDFVIDEREKSISDMVKHREELDKDIAYLHNNIANSLKSQEYLLNQIRITENKYLNEKEKYNDIINSRGWKFLDRLRKIVVFFKR